MLRNTVIFLLFLPVMLVLIPVLLGFGVLLIALFLFFGILYVLGFPNSVKKDGEIVGLTTHKGFLSRKKF